MDTSRIGDLKIDGGEFKTYWKGEWFPCLIWRGWVENLKVYFVDPHHPDLFFSRGCFYGCEDDADRFLFFSRAVLEFLKTRRLSPDILHVHDWQTAIVPPLLKDAYKEQELKKVKTVLTIHNLSYQGIIDPLTFDAVGLDSKKYLNWNELQDPKEISKINLMKGGITYTDFITTVSPTYAKEILTPLGGSGLDSLLRFEQKKLKGILNGIDHAIWNPETDPFLKEHFTSREFPKDPKDIHTIDRKGFLKKLLRETLRLNEAYKPIVSCITRLVPQKGISLIKRALVRTLEKGGQFVLLGTSPIPEIQADFEKIKLKYANIRDVHLHLEGDESLAHLIYAGSDMMIVPSIFEPCGLTQLIALRYGTVPIVRNTGGLADTIEDIDYSKEPVEKRNGYRFDYPDEKGIDSALDRAIDCWFHDKEKWRSLEVRGMGLDTTWTHSTKEYLQIYENLCQAAPSNV
jgi:starch synthase